MVHLDGARVLEHVAPPEVGAVVLAGVEVVPELGAGGRQADAHHGELVVNEAGVEAGDEAAGHGSEEDEASHAEGAALKGPDGRVLDGLDCLEGGPWIGQKAMGAEDGQTGEEHPGVADEGSAEMGGEAVLGDAGVRARSEEVILQTRLDHPPSDEALEPNQTRDAEDIQRHLRGHLAAYDKVHSGQHERHADEAAPEPMGPLHEEDLLELVERHVRVEELKLGRGAVLVELGVPVFEGHGWQGAGDGLPFGDAQTVPVGTYPLSASQLSGLRSPPSRRMGKDQRDKRKERKKGRRKNSPRLCQAREATKDDDAEDASGAA